MNKSRLEEIDSKLEKYAIAKAVAECASEKLTQGDSETAELLMKAFRFINANY
jgi:hypothetical protein